VLLVELVVLVKQVELAELGKQVLLAEQAELELVELVV
jgi:hypothetical protein